LSPTLTALCAGYEGGRWRAKELAAHMMEWLPEFALSYQERQALRHNNTVRMLRAAAQRVYATKKFENRGEFGELLLHIAARQVFNTLPAISKIYYKDADNDTVKGFDAVHVLAAGAILELWLGEVKFYDNIARAIREVVEELGQHTTPGYLRREAAAIINKIDPQWPHADRLKKLLDPNTSLDTVFDAMCIPVLLTYNSDVLNAHDRVNDAFHQAFTAEVSAHHGTFSRKTLPPLFPAPAHDFVRRAWIPPTPFIPRPGIGTRCAAISKLPAEIRHQFIKTDYKTVVCEMRKVDPKDDDIAELVTLCKTLKDPTLIFCRSPQRARDVAQALLDGGVGSPREQLQDAVDWVAQEYHPRWLFGRALAQGIGLHHGQLPRTLGQYVVKAFNEGDVQFLVCTSTLIEGVNTKAKNVVVFDNQIARRKYDFFTYNNILGRSGRMFQHFIGHVYVFRTPPAEHLPLIDVPVFTQPDEAPESLLIQIDAQDLGAHGERKIADLVGQEDVDLSALRESRGVDPRAMVRLARAIREHAGEWWPLLRWNGMPRSAELKLVCRLIWDYLMPDRRMRAGVVSGAQLAFRIERLRHQGSASGLIRSAIASGEEDPNDAVENTIEFLRYWANFNFPKYLMAVDRVQRAVFKKMNRAAGNYEYFAGQIENWFLDPAIMALDEYGISIQVGQKLQPLLNPQGDLDTAISRLRTLDLAPLQLSRFERSLVEDAIAHL